jgi:hypothetical protein
VLPSVLARPAFPGRWGVWITAPLGTVLLADVALWPDMISTWLFARSHYSHGLIGLGSFASGTKSCVLVSIVLLGVFEVAISGIAVLQVICCVSGLGPYAVSLPDVLLSLSSFPLPQVVTRCIIVSWSPHSLHCAVFVSFILFSHSFVGRMSWITLYHMAFREFEAYVSCKFSHTCIQSVLGCSRVILISRCALHA